LFYSDFLEERYTSDHCGRGALWLTAALTLQQAGVPFVIFDRATRAKLCANVGSVRGPLFRYFNFIRL